MRSGNRWMNLIREIRLDELMKLVPDDEIVVVYDEKADVLDREEAIFDGEVAEYWKTVAANPAVRTYLYKVCEIRPMELDDTVGPVLQILVY